MAGERRKDAQAVVEVDPRDMLASLHGLLDHPQDHGWRAFFETIHLLLRNGSAPLLRILNESVSERPELASPHNAMLLGAALKSVVDPFRSRSEIFDASVPRHQRAGLLEEMMRQHEEVLTRILLLRQHSFTGVRRFLVPQVLFASYFARQGRGPVNFLDLGTGLGILPRQLNNRHVFERFCRDLIWPLGIPSFAAIPLGRRFGIDKAPLPDLEWVRHCYGPSPYYDHLLSELMWVLDATQQSGHDVVTLEMDILDVEQLGDFMREHQIGAVNCSCVLYQYEAWVRDSIVSTVRDNLASPGLLVSMEPRPDLAAPGCHIQLTCTDQQRSFRFATVTDSHFIGQLRPAEDYQSFTDLYL
jgi:hypothetical protein